MRRAHDLVIEAATHAPAGTGREGAVPFLHERRSHPAAPRRSWAAEVPFAAHQDRPLLLPRRRWWQRYRVAVLGGDAMAALLVVGLVASTLGWSWPGAAQVTAVALVAWLGTLTALRAYDRRRLGAGPQEFQSVLRAGAALAVVVSVVSYVTVTEVPRRFLVLALPVLVLVSALWRHVVRRRLHAVRRQGRGLVRTLLVGSASAVTGVEESLATLVHEGHHVVGVCGPDEDCLASDGTPLTVLGPASEIPQVVHDHQVDVVIVVGGHLTNHGLRRLSWALEHAGADLVVAPGIVEVLGPRLTLRPTAGLSLLHVESVASRRAQAVGKRVLDIVLGGALAMAALPVVGLAAVLVRTTTPGPAFFRQTRVGQDGRTFAMYKLRTMVVDAEARRVELLGSSDRDGLMFKMRRDPRVTQIGAFLRRFSLDELPQFFNVVRGDMSLVGPRPPLAEEYGQYHDEVYRRMRVRPGLTGLWQVSGRADLSWKDAVRLDLRYVDNWSVTMDLFIIWKTARSVLRGSGAY